MSINETVQSPLDAFRNALKRRIPEIGKQAKSIVAESFTDIEENKAQGMPLSMVLREFNQAYGMSLKLPYFRQLISAERIRRRETLSSGKTPEVGRP